MKRQVHIIRVFVIAAGLGLSGLSAGCGSQIQTIRLARPINATATWSIGAITDGLPAVIPSENRPTQAHLTAVGEKLRSRIEQARVFEKPADSANGELEVRANVIEYIKGSPMTHYLVTPLAGDAVVVAELQVRDRATGEVLYAGNFRGVGPDWIDSGATFIDNLAYTFAQALRTEQSRLRRGY